MINGTAPVSRSSVLTNMLDAPVTELTMGDDVNIGEDLLDTMAL
jgi:hypothetical protein